MQAFLFSKDKEAIDEAIREVEANKDLELDEQLAERLTSAEAVEWRSIGPLGKLHNIAVHIRGSEARFNGFKDLAGRALGLDNDTRWNSWYLLLLTAIELRGAINQYAEKYYIEMEEDYLSPAEWQTLEETAVFLQPFYRVTLETEGDLSTLDKTLHTMDILIKHFEKSQVRPILFVETAVDG